MLPLPYTQNKALGTLSGFLRTIQQRLPPVARTRRVTRRGGQLLEQPYEETYLVQPKALSDGAQATIRLVLMMQLRAVEEARRVSFLQEPATDAAPTPPPVATNNEELARRRNVSSRAIRDHLSEGIRLGIITAKNFRGTQANFELWVSTKFLWKTDAQAVSPQAAENREKAAPAAVASPQATNFPLIEVLEKQYKKDRDSSVVEMLPTDPGQATLTGNTGPQPTPEPAPTPAKPPRQAKRARKDSGRPGGAKGPADAKKELFAERCREMAREFFYQSWKTLYPGEAFDEHEQTLWKKAVWHGVYRGFEARLSEKEWELYHRQALKRLGLVATYLLTHPERYLPKPFAEFVAGTGYFDAANRHGFVATEQWYARKQAANRQLSLSRDLSAAKKTLNAHRLGLAPKRQQGQTRVQLYRYLENKLRGKYGPAGLALFHAAVAAPAQ